MSIGDHLHCILAAAIFRQLQLCNHACGMRESLANYLPQSNRVKKKNTLSVKSNQTAISDFLSNYLR